SGKTLELKPTELAQFVAQARGEIVREQEYIYGPSWNLNAMEVDGVEYPITPFDPQKIFLRSGFLGASCPHAYTYSTLTGTWSWQGHILYGKAGKEKEETTILELRSFDGRVLIRELEPESSFLDYLFVRAVR